MGAARLVNAVASSSTHVYREYVRGPPLLGDLGWLQG
jgi:hypothetical protein